MKPTRPAAAKRLVVKAVWPNPKRRPVELTRASRAQARQAAEDLELKGARVQVTEWSADGPCVVAVLDAFAKRRQLPSSATHADKVAAIRADLADLATQTKGRRALR